MVTWIHEFKHSTRLAARSHYFTIGVTICNRKFYSNTFFSSNSRLLNPFPLLCFPVNYDLQKSICNIESHFLFFFNLFFSCSFYTITFSQFLPLSVNPSSPSDCITLIEMKKFNCLNNKKRCWKFQFAKAGISREIKTFWSFCQILGCDQTENITTLPYLLPFSFHSVNCINAVYTRKNTNPRIIISGGILIEIYLFRLRGQLILRVLIPLGNTRPWPLVKRSGYTYSILINKTLTVEE